MIIAREQSKKKIDKLKITAPERSALRVWRAEQICSSGAPDNPTCNRHHGQLTGYLLGFPVTLFLVQSYGLYNTRLMHGAGWEIHNIIRVAYISKYLLLFFVNLFLSVICQKKTISDFWDLNQGPKSRLQSSNHSSASPPPPAEAINIIYHPTFRRAV
jgi:hypothetical protein